MITSRKQMTVAASRNMEVIFGQAYLSGKSPLYKGAALIRGIPGEYALKGAAVLLYKRAVLIGASIRYKTFMPRPLSLVGCLS
jgi:hypothetical protein